MFKGLVTEPCNSVVAHWAHEWRDEGWWFFRRKYRCPGVKPTTEEEVWRMANPSLYRLNVVRGMAGLPPHRHFFKMTNTLITPEGMTVSPKNIYWQCDCWEIRMMDRQLLHKELTRKQVYQTWPG